VGPGPRPHGPAERDAGAASDGLFALRRAPGEGTHVEEVLVTARKREESLQETPVAVTALTQESLRQMGATRLDDIKSATFPTW